MARFYADIRGNRGPASRMGTAASGMQGHIRGWHVGASVHCGVDQDGNDVVSVYATGGSNGHKGPSLIAQLQVNPDNGKVEVTIAQCSSEGIRFSR